VKAVVIRKFSGTNRGRESFERFRQRATDHSSKQNCCSPFVEKHIQRRDGMAGDCGFKRSKPGTRHPSI
jgi:hypothetical protein